MCKMLHCALVFLFLSFTLYKVTTGEKTCEPGLYGSNCDLNCSSGCREKKCELDEEGIPQCTDGCKPGRYGRQCKIPCQPPGDSCQKCPRMCQDGFCQLGSRCVSGCVDSYYGTDCSTCGPDCESRTDNKAVPVYGSVFGILCILVAVLVGFLVCRYKSIIRSWSASCVSIFRGIVSRDSNPDVSMSRESGLDMHRVEVSRVPAYAVVRKTPRKTTGDGYHVVTQMNQDKPPQDLYEDIDDPEEFEDPDGTYDRIKHVS